MSYYKIRPRSGTASQWSSANPVLKEREIGYEIPDGGVGTGKVKLKMGDGVTNWNNLPYAQVIPDIVDNATTNDSTKVPSAKVAKNLQDQITTLNNSLGIWEEFIITPFSATAYNYAKGFYNDTLKLVKIEFEAYNTNAWNSQTAVGKIPEKYRPKGSRYIGGSIYGNQTKQQTYCPFEIRADGSIIQRISSGTYTQARCFGIYNI